MEQTRVVESGRLLRGGGSAIVGSRSLRIVVSSGERARDGLALEPHNWVLPRTGKVPLLDSHSDSRAGIRSILGDVDGFEVRTVDLASGRSGPALLGTANFAEADVSEDAEIALALYRAGYAESFSVSFIPNWDGATDRITPSSQELLECSCVAVPADRNAVVLARAVRASLNGRQTREDRRALARAARERCRRDDTAHGYGHLWRGE
jgi:hypothetical protein